MKELITAVFVLILLGLQISVFLPKGSAKKFFVFMKYTFFTILLLIASIFALVVPVVGHFIYVCGIVAFVWWIGYLLTNTREFKALDHRITRWTDEELKGE